MATSITVTMLPQTVTTITGTWDTPVTGTITFVAAPAVPPPLTLADVLAREGITDPQLVDQIRAMARAEQRTREVGTAAPPMAIGPRAIRLRH